MQIHIQQQLKSINELSMWISVKEESLKLKSFNGITFKWNKFINVTGRVKGSTSSQIKAFQDYNSPIVSYLCSTEYE